MNKPPTRYYFWEQSKSYGLRQMGNSQGWSHVDELLKDMECSIEHNREHGSPCWVFEAKPILRIESGHHRASNTGKC